MKKKERKKQFIRVPLLSEYKLVFRILWARGRPYRVRDLCFSVFTCTPFPGKHGDHDSTVLFTYIYIHRNWATSRKNKGKII